MSIVKAVKANEYVINLAPYFHLKTKCDTSNKTVMINGKRPGNKIKDSHKSP